MATDNISLVGGYLNIPEREWRTLRELDKTFVKDAIHDLIESENIPLPYRMIDEEDARRSFQELCDAPLAMKSDIGDCFSRYDYSWWTKDLASVWKMIY